MKRILVTRPEPGASRAALRLQELGYEAIKLPLTRTIGLNPQFAKAPFDIVIATSAQAFYCLPDGWVEKLAGLPVAVVGAMTAQAARRSGFGVAHIAGKDVSGLLDYLQNQTLPSTRILYLCGKVRRLNLEEGLNAQGRTVESIEIYDTKSVSYSTDKLTVLGTEPICAVLLTSVKNAEAFNRLIAQVEVKQLFDNSQFICFSQRIAEELPSTNSPRIIVCRTPDEDSMMAALLEHCPA